MIYEVRTYTLRPGTVGEFESRFEKRHSYREKYSKLGAFWHTDFGTLNQVIHVWEYDDLDHRTDGGVRLGGAVRPVGKTKLRTRAFKQGLGDEQPQTHAFVPRPALPVGLAAPPPDKRIADPAQPMRRIAGAVIDDAHRDQVIGPHGIDPDRPAREIDGVLH